MHLCIVQEMLHEHHTPVEVKGDTWKADSLSVVHFSCIILTGK